MPQDSTIPGLDWWLAQDPLSSVLAVSTVGGIVFLLYGIFNGKPPFFQEKSMDQRGRSIALWLGCLLMSMFFIVQLSPLVYYSLKSEALTVYVGDTPIGSDVSVMAVDARNNRVTGEVSIRRQGGNMEDIVMNIPTLAEEVEIYTSPVRVFGKRTGKEYELVPENDRRVYVSDDNGRIKGPLKIKDEKGKVITEILTKNQGSIVIPEDASVTFYDAAVLYKDEKGLFNQERIGSQLDERKYCYGKYEPVLLKYKRPVQMEVNMIGERYAGKPMKSGRICDPNEVYAASNMFPIGTRLWVTNPFDRDMSCEVAVMDATQNGRLVLSSKAYTTLGYMKNARATVLVQVIDAPGELRE